MSKVKLKVGSDKQRSSSLLFGGINFKSDLQRNRQESPNIRDVIKYVIYFMFISLFLIVGISGYGLYGMQKNARSLYEYRLKTVANLNQINELLFNSDLTIKNVAALDTNTKKTITEPLLNNLEVNNIAILDLIKTVTASAKGVKEKELVGSISTAYEAWFTNNVIPIAQSINKNNMSVAIQQLDSSKAQKETLLLQLKDLSTFELEMAKTDLVIGQESLYLYLAVIVLLSIASMLYVSHLLYRAKNSLNEQLGATPETLIEAVGSIASGNLKYSIPIKDGDHSSALAAAKAVQEEFKLLMLDTEILNKSMSEGKMLGRRNLDQHQGDFSKFAEQLNVGIDHALNYGQESEKKRRNLELEIEKTEAEIASLKNAFCENKLNQRLSVDQGTLSMNLIHLSINDCMDVLSNALMINNQQPLIPATANDKIENLQIGIKDVIDEQMKILKDSHLKHDEISLFNITNSKKSKYTQEYAIKISKAIEEIASHLQNIRNNNDQIHASINSQGNLVGTNITNQSQLNEEQYSQLSEQLQLLKEFSNEIILDSNSIIITNMEQNIVLGKARENFLSIERLRERSELLVSRTLATLNEFRNGNLNVRLTNHEVSTAICTDDIDLIDHSIKDAANTEKDAIRSDKVQDLDWRLF